MTYCQLKISKEAIKLLADSKGQIPANFMEALKEITQSKATILEKDAKLDKQDAIIRDKDAAIRERNEKIL